MSKDYGRKPYISKSFWEMMGRAPLRSVWESKMQKHSEFEKPYKDIGYERMQYYWPNLPGISPLSFDFDFPWSDDGPFDCEDMWDQLYEAYTPFKSANDVWALIEAYSDLGCPLVFHSCYLGKACYCPGETVCFSAWCTAPPDGGGYISGKTDPTTTVVYDHRAKEMCISAGSSEHGHIKIVIRYHLADAYSTLLECSDCEACGDAYIGYTTQSMGPAEQQTLTVIGGAIGGSTYNWEISAGGGTLNSSTGTEVVYTSPSENPNCESSPTIKLKVRETECDQLQISVNTYYNPCKHAGYKYCTIDPGSSPRLHCIVAYSCFGAMIPVRECPSGWGSSGHCLNCPGCEQSYPDYQATTNWGERDGVEDIRTASMIEQGCCPDLSWML